MLVAGKVFWGSVSLLVPNFFIITECRQCRIIDKVLTPILIGSVIGVVLAIGMKVFI